MKKVLLILFTFLYLFSFKNSFASTFEIKTKSDDYEYMARVYKSTDDIKAILIVSPTLNNYEALQEATAKYFAKLHYLVILMYPFPTELNQPYPDTERLDQDFFRPVVAANGFLNLVDEKFDISHLPVLAIGSSQGGIFTTIIASHIPRVKAAWMAAAGGDLPYIYAHSTIKELQDFRDRHMRTLGLTNVIEYENFLRMHLKNDPLYSCVNIKIPFHQTIATRDTIVPTKTQELLNKKCPISDVYRMNGNHGSATVSIITMRREVHLFFEKALLQSLD